MDDSALVTAMARRDPHGLDGAYRRYADRLYAYVRSLTGDSESAADLVQDTFILASQHVEQLREPSRLRPWLYAIARNEANRHLRGRSRTTTLESIGDLAGEAAEPAASVQQAQVVELVRSAVAGLSEGDREIAELALRHAMSAADIASMLGLSAKHAHARLSRVRAQLTVALGALLVARRPRGDCLALDAMLLGWDGRLTPLLRKRLNRHVESCESCATVRDEQMSPAALLSGYAGAPFAPMLMSPQASGITGNPLPELPAVAPDGGSVSPPADHPPGPPVGKPAHVPGAEPGGVGEQPLVPGMSGGQAQVKGPDPGQLAPSAAPEAPAWDGRTGFPIQADAKRRSGSKTAIAVAAASLAIVLCGGGVALLAPGPPAAEQAPLAAPDPTQGPHEVVTTSSAPASTPTSPAGPSEEAPTAPVTPPTAPPGSAPPPAWSIDSVAEATCVRGNFILAVRTGTNTELAAAELAYRVGIKKYPRADMTVSGRDASVRVHIPILGKVTWWVELEAVDGRTLRGPTMTTDHPC